MSLSEFDPVFALNEPFYAHVLKWLHLEDQKQLVVFMDRLTDQYKTQKFYILFKGVTSCSFSRSAYIEEAKLNQEEFSHHVLYKRRNAGSNSSSTEFITFNVPCLSSLTIKAESFELFGEKNAPLVVPH